MYINVFLKLVKFELKFSPESRPRLVALMSISKLGSSEEIFSHLITFMFLNFFEGKELFQKFYLIKLSNKYLILTVPK